MTSSSRATARTLWVAVRTVALLTVLLGLAYTAALTGLGQILFPTQANGSLAMNQAGQPVGSLLLGQSFLDANGEPLARYFQPRPSAAGAGYDAGASSGSNHGPENADLIAAITERIRAVAAVNGVAPDQVPVDAVTASASGLDPHISPAYAEIQLRRVAVARGLSLEAVRALVQQHTQTPLFGYLGESTVNVLEINLALDERGG